MLTSLETTNFKTKKQRKMKVATQPSPPTIVYIYNIYKKTQKSNKWESSNLLENLCLRENQERERMDCCICSPLASLYRPPRNTICPSCYEGAKCMISFFAESSSDREMGASAKIHGSKPSSSKASCYLYNSELICSL